MRVIGKNFVAPGFSASESDSESESAAELNDAYWNGVLRRMFAPGVDFENDPDPYELHAGYDAGDPRFPDRRWRQRIGLDNIAVPEEEELWQEHLSTYEKEPPFTIEAEDFDRDLYHEWLLRQQSMENDPGNLRFRILQWEQEADLERPAASEEEELQQDHLDTYQKEPIFTIAPKDFNRNRYRQWLANQRLNQGNEIGDDDLIEDNAMEVEDAWEIDWQLEGQDEEEDQMGIE